MAHLCDKEPDSHSVLRCPLRLMTVCVTVLMKMWPGPGPWLDKPGCHFWPRVCPDHRGVTGPARAFIFPSIKGGAGLSLQGGRGGRKRQCLGKPLARSSRGSLGSRGGACQGHAAVSGKSPDLPALPGAPRLCAHPPFPRGVVCNQRVTNADSVCIMVSGVLFFYLLKTFPGLWEDRLEPSGRRDLWTSEP